MDGYETRPSIADLSKMSEAELAAVPNFVIARPGYGEVAWEGTVDVRDADLDRIISINPKDVAVYQIEEDEVFPYVYKACLEASTCVGDSLRFFSIPSLQVYHV